MTLKEEMLKDLKATIRRQKIQLQAQRVVIVALCIELVLLLTYGR